MSADAPPAAPAALERQFSMGSVSSRVCESAVFEHPVQRTWNAINNMGFEWWTLVTGATLTAGASAAEVGSIHTLTFADGMTWTVELTELSNIHHSITFEVIASEPALEVSSMVNTLRLHAVTSTNGTFLEWITNFSNDATAAIVSDAVWKRRDAFTDLASALAQHAEAEAAAQAAAAQAAAAAAAAAEAAE